MKELRLTVQSAVSVQAEQEGGKCVWSAAKVGSGQDAATVQCLASSSDGVACSAAGVATGCDCIVYQLASSTHAAQMLDAVQAIVRVRVQLIGHL